jgi:hypothetical protein
MQAGGMRDANTKKPFTMKDMKNWSLAYLREKEPEEQTVEQQKNIMLAAMGSINKKKKRQLHQNPPKKFKGGMKKIKDK